MQKHYYIRIGNLTIFKDNQLSDQVVAITFYAGKILKKSEQSRLTVPIQLGNYEIINSVIIQIRYFPPFLQLFLLDI